jgi:hypothetical protein
VWKCDDSLKSFLFTLKNPHNTATTKFALITERKQRAIFGSSSSGPHLRGFDIHHNCNANTKSGTYIGYTDTNDTGLDGNIVFTGSKWFKVREIEVFEITD